MAERKVSKCDECGGPHESGRCLDGDIGCIPRRALRAVGEALGPYGMIGWTEGVGWRVLFDCGPAALYDPPGYGCTGNAFILVGEGPTWRGAIAQAHRMMR